MYLGSGSLFRYPNAVMPMFSSSRCWQLPEAAALLPFSVPYALSCAITRFRLDRVAITDQLCADLRKAPAADAVQALLELTHTGKAHLTGKQDCCTIQKQHFVSALMKQCTICTSDRPKEAPAAAAV